MENTLVKTRLYRIIVLAMVMTLYYHGISLGSVPPHITAESAILYDKNTGQVLYEKNSKEERPPASTTKVLTGILAVDMASTDEIVKISKHSASIGEASIHLTTGEALSVHDLILGALIKSGNDASVALAEAAAGNENYFVFLMNRKAFLLGAGHTNFINPNGLHHNEHFSTAYDLAVIADYAMDNPIFRDTVARKTAVIPENNTTWKRYLKNTNRLLGQYPGANGVKTGTTNAAGQCLVASAARGDRSLIVVVLKSYNRYGDTVKLLDFGFNDFKEVSIPKGTVVGRMYFPDGKPHQVDLLTTEDFNLTVNTKEILSLEKRLVVNRPKKLPVAEGKVLGNLWINLRDKELKIPVTVKTKVESMSIKEKLEFHLASS
ncbi:MAG: D-alanyl-D-alanine carboxypeptidase [Clostridia bacterium]|nr:D-alanyl-D-alanine carboxypeptidase [Clostridia bacterium]